MGKTLDFFHENGHIDNVSHCAQCRYNCCRTDKDNFIVLFPWEREAANAAGLKTDHLQSIRNNPDYVHCTRPCIGENDYKPINCATYPLYPIVENMELWVRGAKNRCPIPDDRLLSHMNTVVNGMNKIKKFHPGSIKIMVDFILKYPGALEVFGYNRIGKKLSDEQLKMIREEIMQR